MRYFYLFLIVLLAPGLARANCSNPDSVAGGMIYNSDYQTMQFCDGAQWWSMKGDTMGPLRIAPDNNAPCNSSMEGGLRWNASSKTVEICNGTAWLNMVQVDQASNDDAPDAFSFTDLTGQSLSTQVYSNTLTITGFDGPILASVTGSGSPALRVNGGAWVSSASINPGDTLQIRQLSSASVSTATVAAVTVGSVPSNWSVTTRAGQLRIFLTSGTYNGNLGGLTGADAKCQKEAGIKGYSGTWKAILSDETTNAKDRLTVVYPVVRASDGGVVAAADLWNGNLQNMIYGTANATWTGTLGSGSKVTGQTCSSWSTASSGTQGEIGQPGMVDGRWLQSSSYACNNTGYFYCIEQ